MAAENEKKVSGSQLPKDPGTKVPGNVVSPEHVRNKTHVEKKDKPVYKTLEDKYLGDGWHIKVSENCSTHCVGISLYNDLETDRSKKFTQIGMMYEFDIVIVNQLLKLLAEELELLIKHAKGSHPGVAAEDITQWFRRIKNKHYGKNMTLHLSYDNKRHHYVISLRDEKTGKFTNLFVLYVEDEKLAANIYTMISFTRTPGPIRSKDESLINTIVESAMSTLPTFDSQKQ